jgi:hypothetical protein
VNQLKRLAVVKLQEAFSTRHDREAEKEEELRDRLYREIGQLKVELDWLKKNVITHDQSSVLASWRLERSGREIQESSSAI